MKQLDYDGSGNPTSYYNGTRWTFGWEEGRNLVSAAATGKQIFYTYDHEGIRTSKTVNGTTHNYVYASGKLLRETYGENVLDFFYDANGRPFALKYNGTVYYYILNVQGDVLRMVDADGTVVANYRYDPYGNIVAATGDLAEINPLRYRGYYYDSDTALYYLQSRYYDPKIGRFINADGFISTGQGITGNNMFAYCGNNPIIRADCCGHCYYTSNGIWAHDAWEYLGGYERQPDPQTYEELSVLNGGTVTMYKDVPVIRTSILGDSGFSFGGILLGADIQATNSGVRIIRHEYGHTVQLGELGFIGYTYFVVAPSVYFYNLDRAGVLGVHYYSLPWEYEADMYGNVQGRTGYAQQADQAYYAYKVIVSALCGNGVDMSYASRMNS